MKRGCCSWLAMKALYAHVYNNHYSASHFILQTHRIIDKLTYINTSSPIVYCFPETMVTSNVESINGRLITLVSALFTDLTVKMMPSLCVYCIYIMHDCIIALYGFKHRIAPLICDKPTSHKGSFCKALILGVDCKV